MTTLHTSTLDGPDLTAIVKGAPEVVLERCDRIRRPDGSTAPLDEATRRAIEERNEALAGEALRTLAFASRRLDGEPERLSARTAVIAERPAAPASSTPTGSSATWCGRGSSA